jgi:type IV pilus assembly protein PilE
MDGETYAVVIRTNDTPAATFVGLRSPSVDTRFCFESHAVRLRSILDSSIAMNLKRTRGFTLLEIMIVVVIVGILAAIVLQQYRQQVIRANRSAAQQFLSDVATRQQQLQLDQRSYQLVALSTSASDSFKLSPASGGINLPIPSTTAGYYKFEVNPATATAFTATATPVTGSIQANDGNLSIDQAGNKVGKW